MVPLSKGVRSSYALTRQPGDQESYVAKPHDPDLGSIETLLAMFEHEVRSPLNAILGFSELLKPEMARDELEDLVARIRANAKLLGDVVEGLADMRDSSQELRERREDALSLRGLLEEVVASFRASSDAGRLELLVDIGSDVPSKVLGSRGMLRVVLQNLVGNAIKFTERGKVVLRVQSLDHTGSDVRLRYSVEDTGDGIPVADRESLVQPFVRGEQSSTKPGMGLGLAICSSLLRAWGSRIQIESRDSRGSVVSFELRHAIPEEFSSEPRSKQTHRDEPAPSALLVDDDEDSLEVLRRLVEREGFSADVARDGHTALALVARRPYAIVLTDLHMSGMNGIELARRIRRQSRPAGLTKLPPLIAVTASSTLREPAGESVSELFDEVLLKPIRPRVLAQMLAPYRGWDRRASRATPLPDVVDTSVFRVAADYPQRRARDVRVLREFLKGQAPVEDVIRIGHRMKGTSATYGFPRLGELGAALERAGRAADVSKIARITDAIERVVVRMQRAANRDENEGSRGA